MFDFLGKVTAVFILAACITTGAIALSNDGNLSLNVFQIVRITWNAFVDLSDQAQNGSAPNENTSDSDSEERL